MGNSASIEDSADLESTCQSVRRLQVEDDLLAITSTSGDHRLNRNSRQKLRSQLFTCNSDEPGIPTRESPFASSESVGKPTSSTSSSSTTKEHGNVDVSEVLSILKEVRKSASPDELIALQKALLPSSTEILVLDSADASPSKKTAGGQTLLRRTSFATPGLATRQSTKISRKPTSSTPVSPRKWSTDMFGQSPLSKLAGWESENNGLAERAVTPDINYLGIHELGTLRVTNGAVSPNPSVRKDLPTNPSTASFKQDDYFTASEGSEVESPDEQSTRSAHSPRQVDSDTLQALSGSTQQQGADVDDELMRCETDEEDQSSSTEPSPIRSHCSTEIAEDLTAVETDISRAGSLYHHVANSNPFLTTELDEELIMHVANEDETSPISPTVSPVALYQTEAFSNPFLPLKSDEYNDSYTAIQFQTHKREESVSSIESIMDDFDAHTGSKQSSRHNFLPHPLLSVYPGSQSAASSIYTSGSRKEKSISIDMPKTDSGYHSQTSLRTYPETDVADEKAPTNIIVARDNHQQLLEQSQTELSTPNVPLSVPYTLTTSGPPPKPILETSSPSKSPAREPSSFASVDTSPASTNTVIRHTSDTETGRFLPRSKSSPIISTMVETSKPKLGPKKLQKKSRPISVRSGGEPVIVQSQDNLQPDSPSLPQIPDALSLRYTRRLTEQPNMEHLERTFKSISHCNSRDSFSSFQPFNIQNIRFPSPTRPTGKSETVATGNGSRRHSFGAEKYMRELLSRNKPKFDDEHRGRSESKHHHQRHMNIADFGTVTTSLGSSPFDLAIASDKAGKVADQDAVKRRSPQPKSIHGPRQMTHPYQMGANLPCNTPFVGMTDEDASAFAMRKSRDALDSFNGPLPKSSHREMPTHTEVAPRGTRHGRSKSTSDSATEEFYRDTSLRKHSLHGARTRVAEKSDNQNLPRSGSQSPQRNGHATPNMESPGDSTNTQTLTQSTKDTDDWSDFAKAWRERRKSIGENLSRGVHAQEKSLEDIHPALRPKSAHIRSCMKHSSTRLDQPSSSHPSAGLHNSASRSGESNQASPPKPTRPPPAPPNRTPPAPDRAPPLPPRRSPSPTPSVLERAAAYDREITRKPLPQTPSSSHPPNHHPNQSSRHLPSAGSTPRRNAPAEPMFRPTASAPVTPSKIASAYTTSHLSPSRNSQLQYQADMPKLTIPRKRPSWPTSAFPPQTAP